MANPPRNVQRNIVFPVQPAAAAGGPAAAGPFPFSTENNKFFTALGTQVTETNRISTAIDDFSDEVAKASGAVPGSIYSLRDQIEKGGGATTKALEDIKDAISKAGGGPAVDVTPIVTAVKDLQATIQHLTDVTLQRRTTDNVTALYAAAIDTTGDIVDRTLAGRWLNEAGFTTLASFARGRKVKRDDFIARLMQSAPKFGALPSIMNNEEIGRFFDLAPSVLDAIEQSKPPAGPAGGGTTT